MTPDGDAARRRPRRYLVVRAGTYVAPSVPRAGAAVAEAEPEARAVSAVSRSRSADIPDFGLTDAFPAPTATGGDVFAPRVPGSARPAAAADWHLQSTRKVRPASRDRRVWARRSTRRMLLGTILGGALGMLVGLFMMWVFRGGAPLAALSDPVRLWRGADQYRQLAAILVTVGFAVLGAARGIRSGGDADSRSD